MVAVGTSAGTASQAVNMPHSKIAADLCVQPVAHARVCCITIRGVLILVWRIGVACVEGLHIAGDLAAGLDDDFAVAHFAVYPPAGADNKPFAGDQITR